MPKVTSEPTAKLKKLSRVSKQIQQRKPMQYTLSVEHQKPNNIISLSLLTTPAGKCAQGYRRILQEHTLEPPVLSAPGFLPSNSSAMHQQGCCSESLKTVYNVGPALRIGEDSVFPLICNQTTKVKSQ